jgi:hypothetical protein
MGLYWSCVFPAIKREENREDSILVGSPVAGCTIVAVWAAWFGSVAPLESGVFARLLVELAPSP